MKPNFGKQVPLHPKVMNSGPKDYQPMHSLPSNYNASLASDKFFSQKEINSKPSKRINAALAKKSGPEVKQNKFGADFDELESMRSSSSSFYDNNQQVAISNEQKERIRSRPFSGKFKPPRIREEKYEPIAHEEEIGLEDCDRESTTKSIQDALQEREEKVNEFTNYLENMKQFGAFGQELDQLVDENQSREELQRQVMDNNYMKDRIEEHRMSSSICSESEVDVHSQISYEDLKDQDRNSAEKPKQILYKPPVPSKKDKTQEPSTEENDGEGIDDIRARIAKQLEGFHKQKQLALADCEEFFDDIESKCDDEGNKLVNIPEEFDDIVDIAVEEQQMANEEGVELNDKEKPFWMNYFKADYLGESDPTYQRLLQKEGIQTAEEIKEESKTSNVEIQEKLMKEYARIRDFDREITQTNKVYKAMKAQATLRDEETRYRLDKEKEEKNKQVKMKSKNYIKSNTRKMSSRASARSNASKSSKNSKKSLKSSKGFSTNPFTGMRRPDSSKRGNKPPKPKQAPTEDDSSTFLTGVQNQDKYSKMDKRIKDEMGIDVNPEFDRNKNYELEMITAHEEAISQAPERRKKYKSEISSQMSSNGESKVDFIKENASKIGGNHAKSYTDRLSDHEKLRLQQLEDEIEQSFLGDEENAQKLLAISDKSDKERLELMSSLVPAPEAGETDATRGMKNAFVYEDGKRVEEINDQLRTRFLALPPAEENQSDHDEVSSMANMQSSVFGGGKSSDKNADIFSERSVQLSQFSKRSGISGISHSLVSKLNKPVSLPKDKFLRNEAEDKLSKQSLKEIESNLDRIRNIDTASITEDQMSLLIQECQKENDQVAMMETNEEDEDDEDYNSTPTKDYSQEVVLYSSENTKLDEAQELLDDLTKRFEAYKEGNFPVDDDEPEEEQKEAEEEHKKITAEEGSLKQRLQEQEDNLANIMKEIEEKEALLKKAIEENNKFLAEEGELETVNNNGEISSKAAALKFSSMRGNAMKLPVGVNTVVPTEKIIEEVPEEDDEEMQRLDEMIQNAKDFNEDMLANESQSEMVEEVLRTTEIIVGDDALPASEALLKEEEDMISEEDEVYSDEEGDAS
ncbi:unnamed protein product [Moneuplotes crassus]|uniref:Uncharacterized protein n=2 Tax=Euplotes crassus TaxID=5936 RepID=A0AAD1XPN4_EUPCR|nr:unnamed protein product [Moneuplotes crassus]